MSKKENKITGNQLKTSYLTTVISISLVLFLIGLIGLLLLNTKKLSDLVKENISIDIIIKDNVKEVDMIRMQKNLEASEYVKETRLISKYQAAKELQLQLGEDFVQFLGYNPLLASIEVFLYSKYANPDNIEKIISKLQTNPQVKEIFYQKSLVEKINENVNKITAVILVFTALLFLISLVLINNTIRLSIYSKRFIIRTMQLVGATKRFIRTPFLLKGILQGVYGSLIAIIMIIGVIYLIQKEFYEFTLLFDITIYSILFALIICTGIIITYISTFFSVNKYLRIDKDKLYFK